jgi:hypothetical protein
MQHDDEKGNGFTKVTQNDMMSDYEEECGGRELLVRNARTRDEQKPNNESFVPKVIEEFQSEMEKLKQEVKHNGLYKEEVERQKAKIQEVEREMESQRYRMADAAKHEKEQLLKEFEGKLASAYQHESEKERLQEAMDILRSQNEQMKAEKRNQKTR